MSYTGEILTGAVTLAGYALAAAATLAGTVLVGTAKLTVAAGKAVNEGIKSAKAVSLGRSLEASERNISSLDSELNANMEAARNECYRQYEEEIKKIEQLFSKKPETTSFSEACLKARQNLNEQLASEEKRINSKYIPLIRTELEKARIQAKQTRTEVESSLAKITSEQQKAEKAKVYAESMLAEVNEMLTDLRSRYSGSKKAEKMLETLESSYKRVEEFIAAEMYETALAEVYSLRDTIVLRVGEMLENELNVKGKYINAKALFDACTELLNRYKRFSFRTDKTFNGEIYTEEIENFSVFYRGDYEVWGDRLNSIGRRLDADYTDIAEHQLIDVTEELSQWQSGFISSTIIASERLDNLYLRAETMKMLYSEYSNNGFELNGVDEENELDYISMDLFNPETEENVQLKFVAEKEGGHIAMNILVEDHTEYSGDEAQVEKKRVERRENISKSLAGSAMGNGISLRQRCTNPGVKLR